MKAWDVILNGKCIDTVFWNERADGGAKITKEEVRESLINHDGYHPAIIVRATKSKHKSAPAD